MLPQLEMPSDFFPVKRLPAHLCRGAIEDMNIIFQENGRIQMQKRTCASLDVKS